MASRQEYLGVIGVAWEGINNSDLAFMRKSISKHLLDYILEAHKMGATVPEIKEALNSRKLLSQAERIALRKAGGDPNPFN